MSAIVYLVACLAVPALWSFAAAAVFARKDRRRAIAAPAKPTDYAI